MTTQEYIESGNLEAYVLGALTPQEEAQVRADIAQNPELAKEVALLEEVLLNAAIAGAVTPPPALENNIWAAIQAAGNSTAGKPVEEPVSQQAARTIPLPASQPKVFRNAAVWAALVISMAANGLLLFNSNRQKEELEQQTAKVNKMSHEQQSLAQKLETYRKRADMMADTGMQTIVMHTMVKGHPMAATMYWSKASGDAYVMLDALPQPPKGMQYQLWVIQDNKPVSMGTLPVDMTATASIQKVDMHITGGQAFAISLEKEGGNPTPTTVYVLGKV